MAKSNKTIAIDYTGNPKNSALFFDYVVPIQGFLIAKEIVATAVELEPISILPLPFNKEDSYKKYSKDFLGNYRKGDSIAEKNYIYSIIQALDEFYKHKNLFPIYSDNKNTLWSESYDCTSLELAQLPLIDTSKSEWEQIIQIREDKESISKLRNLKLFFHENYSGKEKNYVEDDLCKRLEEYENVTKDWGFDTVTSSIEMLLTSPVTLTSVGSSLAMALFGQALTALATAGTGAVVEIGKMSLHIAKEKKKLSVLQRDHPLAYIIDAKKKLE